MTGVLVQNHQEQSLEQVHHIKNGCIPEDILCGELATGRRTIDHSKLRCIDICKSDTGTLDLDSEN